MFYAFAKEFGWTPDQIISLPMQQVIMLLNCMTEDADSMKEAHGKDELNESETMEFKPKNKHAKDLSKMSKKDLQKTLKQEFGTAQGGSA